MPYIHPYEAQPAIKMNTSIFYISSACATAFLATGAYYGYKLCAKKAIVSTLVGVIISVAYIGWLWVSLKHPPLSTLGETRLLYSMLLPLIGTIVYARRCYRWILPFTAVMASVFTAICIFDPNIFSKGLMPALRSPWFVPHVALYIIAYALSGTATMTAIYGLYTPSDTERTKLTHTCDSLILTGIACMTLGMLTGALWANDAWGHYWTWDSKETWAAATWLSYIVYLHLRHGFPRSIRPALWILIVSFLLLQMCWWGINLIPAFKGNSLHLYG